jgi:transposase-like protein
VLVELNVMEQRYRAVLQVQAGVPVTEVADAFGVSRQAVHRWLRWYRDEGLAGLADRSRRPQEHPWQIDMRHSYATAALKAGVQLKIVSARLGHASETVTASVYQHALPGMDREAAGTIAALFLGEDAVVSGSVSTGDENGQPDDL